MEISLLAYVEKNDTEAVTQLLHNPRVTYDAFQLLKVALLNRSDEMLKVLVANNVNVNAVNPEPVERYVGGGVDNGGSNILSVVKGRHRLLYFLITAGANVRFNDSACLVDACKAGRDVIAVLYLQQGANPDAHQGQPLMWAVETENAILVRLLLSYGAKVTSAIMSLAQKVGNRQVMSLLQKQTAVIPYNRHLVTISFHTTEEFIAVLKRELAKAGYEVEGEYVTNPITDFRIELVAVEDLEVDMRDLLNDLQELGVAPLTTSKQNGQYVVELDMERTWSKFVPNDQSFKRVNGGEHFEVGGEIYFKIGTEYPSLFVEGVVQPFDRYRDVFTGVIVKSLPPSEERPYGLLILITETPRHRKNKQVAIFLKKKENMFVPYFNLDVKAPIKDYHQFIRPFIRDYDMESNEYVWVKTSDYQVQYSKPY